MLPNKDKRLIINRLLVVSSSFLLGNDRQSLGKFRQVRQLGKHFQKAESEKMIFF